MAYAIMRIAKLKGGQVGASDAHTDRSRKTPNADEERTPNNIYLIGERDEKLRMLVDEEISSKGIKKRKNAVECVEFFFGASPEYFDSESKSLEFAKKLAEFMKKLEAEKGLKFVKAVMHVDELTPHGAAYAVPFNRKGKLSARDTFGGKAKLSELQDSFAETMRPLGLERGIKGSTAKHQTIQQYYGKTDSLDDAVTKNIHLMEENQILRNILSRQLDEQDIPLAELAKTFYPTADTSEGLAVLDQEKQIKAIITGDNQAFEPGGQNISNGSTVKMISSLEQKSAAESLELIQRYFGDEQRADSARAFGNELASTDSKQTQITLDFDQAQKEVDEGKAVEADKANDEYLQLEEAEKTKTIYDEEEELLEFGD